MSGPLTISDLKVYQGVDYTTTRLFFNPATTSTDIQQMTPLDFTGCTGRMMVRLSQDPTSTLLLTLTTPASGLTFVSQTFVPGPVQPSVNNGITITITRAQSLAMNSGVPIIGAYYDIFADQPGGTTLCLMSGQFDLIGTATR